MTKKILISLSGIGFVLLIIALVYGLKSGIFHNPSHFQSWIQKFGDWGPIIFILFQIIEAVFPIIPGGFTDVAGILMFGNFIGLFYTCFGLVIGEFISFLLIRKYGMRVLKILLSPQKILQVQKLLAKYSQHMQKMIIFIFVMPFGPDDLICYAAGLSKLSPKKFLITILLFKPISVAIHCFIVIHLLKAV